MRSAAIPFPIPVVREIPLGKRMLDIGCILLCAPVLLPVMGAIALFIRLVSRGPVLFRQTRVGYRGVPFCLFKFRSMRVDADDSAHASHTTHLFRSNAPMTKLDAADPRLIPLGWLLRASGFDELPQLLNVWRGDMSLVGPRPCATYELGSFEGPMRERFNALPGLTGLWQVSGKNKLTFAEMVALDIAYARRQSLGSDLWILVRTFPVLLGQIWEIARMKLERNPS